MRTPSAPDTRASTKAGVGTVVVSDVLIATSGADDARGVNAVVAVGRAALLFLGRGYPDPAARARLRPCFDSARGLLAANASDLPFANLATACRRRPRSPRCDG